MNSLPSGSHTLIKSISDFDQMFHWGDAISEKVSLDAFCGIEDDWQWMVTGQVEGIT